MEANGIKPQSNKNYSTTILFINLHLFCSNGINKTVWDTNSMQVKPLV